MSTYDLILNAIQHKRIIKATYDGLPREMCPHTLGHTNGVEQALFFQFAGQSSKGLPPGGEWKCMRVGGLSNVTVHDGVWHTGPRHTQEQTCVKQVEVEVAS